MNGQHIAEYKVVTEKSAWDLELRVSELITHGWQPLGGVIVIPVLKLFSADGYWVQAMIQYETPEEA